MATCTSTAKARGGRKSVVAGKREWRKQNKLLRVREQGEEQFLSKREEGEEYWSRVTNRGDNQWRKKSVEGGENRLLREREREENIGA